MTNAMEAIELLQRYAREKDQDAFAEVVHHHGDWVYASARRQLGDEHLAEDVTQAVFLLLSQKAEAVARCGNVGGWMFNTLRYCAKHARLQGLRRERREREAAKMRPEIMEREAGWDEVAPMLDEAVARLSKKDREAILARFYERQGYGEIGQALGVSEEAAKKRVQRALEKLRGALAKKGVMAGAAALGVVMAQNVTAAAPAGLVEAVTAAVGSGGAGSAEIIAKGAIKMMAWAKMKVAAAVLAAAVIVAVAGVATVAVLANREPESLATGPIGPATTERAAEPAVSTPFAADLVREVRASEQWIDKVHSLHLKIEGTWTLTPEGIEWRKERLRQKGFPPEDINVARFPELLPETADRLELAFDSNRLLFRQDAPQSSVTLDHRTYDGRQVRSHMVQGGQEHFSVGKDAPALAGRYVIDNFAWLRAGPHPLWFVPKNAIGDDALFGRPEEFTRVGPEVFEGVDCYVLELERHESSQIVRWYVGTGDHRLYGMQSLSLPNPSPAQVTEMKGAIVEAAKAMHLRLANGRPFERWMESLPVKQQKALEVAMNKRFRALFTPGLTHRMAEYREVAPGCWMPMRQGYSFSAREGSVRDMRISMVSVNQPLADELFVLPLRKGTAIEDVSQVPARPYVQEQDDPLPAMIGATQPATRAR